MNRETALRILGATNCVRDDGMLTGSTGVSHLFASDDTLHTLCNPKREVRDPFVIAGSERPTCVKCRAKFDAAHAVLAKENA
jgi:hypothetical protein